MKRPYYIAVIAYCAVIFWLSHQSSPPVPEMRFPGEDKLAHMVLFGGLATIISVGQHRSGHPRPTWARRYAPILFAAVYGMTDEIHQLFIPLRTFSLLDWLADILGAGLAYGVCGRFFRALPLSSCRDET